jgi:predicted nucleotidyltransferase
MTGAVLSDDIIAAAAELCGRCDAIDAAYLLGSAAAGRLRPESDVDLAILPARGCRMPAHVWRQLAVDLAVIFGREVDLGLLGTANVVYAKEVVATGRLVFQRCPRITAEFEMMTLSRYASLQEARREVLRAYAA